MQDLGRLLRETRQARGLSPEQVAVRMGYRDRRKGGRKLKTIEATGIAPDETLVRLLDVLGLDLADVEERLADVEERLAAA